MKVGQSAHLLQVIFLLSNIQPKIILNNHNLIGVGVFARVHRIDRRRVRKVPAPNPENLDLAVQSIQREGHIYDHLGCHPGVIQCFSRGDLFVDLEYAPNGHIESYLKSHQHASSQCRIRFAREAIEAVEYIHNRGIIHSDLAARQFLLDSTLKVKLSDFGFSSFGDGDVLGWENPSHHLPRDTNGKIRSTIQSDLFALGSTIYEIMTGRVPYKGESDDDITQLYSKGSFPNVKGVLCGSVIMGCWRGRFKSAAEVLGHIPSYTTEMPTP